MSAEWPEVGEALDRVFEAIDWAALGAIYFHEDAESEMRSRRKELRRLGLLLARRMLRRVAPRGASLWAGAGIVELPVLLAEVMRAGRGVTAANLRADECLLLNAALREALPDLGLELVPADAGGLATTGTFDHLGCISVFTDPESFPLLSDVAYGRVAPVQLDVEAFAAERDRARELVGTLFGALQRPGLVTTSAEEAPWFLEQASLAGVPYDADEELVETAMVGDPVGFLRIG